MHLRQLATLRGRATRTQFIAVSALLFAIVFAACWFDPWSEESGSSPITPANDLFMIFVVFPIIIALSWISFATSVRRLHDMNHSGWWYLVTSIPMINAVFLVLLVFMPPIANNDYGADPRAGRNKNFAEG